MTIEELADTKQAVTVQQDLHSAGLAELLWTGERLLPDCRGQILYEHLHRYIVAATLCRGKQVVDVACGTGYGSRYLAEHASHVTGVDVDRTTIDWARQRYKKGNLAFLQGDCRQIPLRSQSCDVVVSFETIEHFAEHEQFLSEIKRILRPKGLLIISTPDKDVYNETLTEPNEYHVKELHGVEFHELLRKYFGNVSLHGQRYLEGSVIDGSPPHGLLERRKDFEIIDVEHPGKAKSKLTNPTYLIALASDGRLQPLSPSLMTSSTDPQPLQLKARLEAAEHTRDGVAGQLVLLQERTADMEAQVAEARRQRDGVAGQLVLLQERTAGMEAQIEEANRQRDGVAGRLDEAERTLEDLRRSLEALQAEREDLSGRLGAAHEQLAAVQATAEQAERQRDGTISRLIDTERAVEAVQARLDAAVAERDDLAGRLAEAERTAADLRARLEAMHGERDGLVARLDAEQVRLAEQCGETERVGRERDETVARLAEAERAAADLRSRLEAAESGRDHLSARLDAAQDALTEAGRRAEQSLRERDALAGEVKDARAAADAERERRAAAERERDGLAVRLDAAREQLAATQSQVDAVGRQRDSTVERLIESERAAESLRARLEAMERERDGLSRRLDGVQAALAKSDEQVERTRKEREGIVERLHATERSVESLEARLAAAQDECRALAGRLARAEADRDAAAGRLAGTEQAGAAARLRMELALQEARQEIDRLEADREAQVRELLEARRAQAESARQAERAEAAVTTLRAELAASQASARERARRELAAGDPALDRPETADLIARTAGTVKNAMVLALSAEMFDPVHYLDKAPDVAAAGLDPFEHYWTHGWAEGRSPNPAFGEFLAGVAGVAVGSGAVQRLFDAEYYLAANEDVRAAGIDPYAHYCLHGWQEGRDPNALFSSRAYAEANPDVALAGLNPLLHYAAFGWREGRDVGGIFDSAHYLDSCPEARDADVSPLEHFVMVGIAEGHRPNRTVDPASFLTAAEMELEPWRRVTRLIRRMEEAAEAAAAIRLPVHEAPELSIIVFARDAATSVVACLASLERLAPPMPFEVLLADHGSRDLLPMMAAHWPMVRTVRCDGRMAWQEVVNRAASQARGNTLLIVDGTVELSPWWASEITGVLHRDQRVGVVGGRILDPSGRLRHAGGLVWRDGSLTVRGAGADSGHPRYSHMRPVDFVSPALMAVRTDLFFAIGGFSRAFSSPAYVAADFGRAVWQRGMTVAYQPLSSAVRFADPADEAAGLTGEAARLREKWSGALDRLPDRPAGGGLEGLHPRGVVGHALVIDQITPTPDLDAGSVTQFFLLDLLVRMGWAVSFVPEVTMENRPGYTTDLQRIGVQCVYAPYYQNLYEFVRDEGRTVDLAMPYRGPAANHYLNIIGPHCPRAKVLLDTVDVHYLREMREAELANSPEKMAQARHTREVEFEAIRRSDCTIVLSHHEEEVLRRELPDARLTVLPLILQCPGRQAPLRELRDICFIGGYRHQPNLDAVRYFIDAIWPIVHRRRPDLRFRIMGSHAPADLCEMERDGIIVDGFVPDLATSLARCRLSVAPLRYGAGIKGKIGSSLSYGIPCVATTVAAEGMGLGPHDGVELADDPEEFAERIVELCSDDAHWQRMSDAGMAFIVREYSLETTADRLAAILGGLGLPTGRNPFA